MDLRKAQYFSNCVSYPDIDELNHIIDSNMVITYRTFRKHVDTKSFNELKRYLGYTEELRKNCNITIENDYSVSFHKSKTPDGTTVYYIRHSAIEYIFK